MNTAELIVGGMCGVVIIIMFVWIGIALYIAHIKCGFHAIRTLSPPTSGHSFHAHSDRQSERSDAGLHC